MEILNLGDSIAQLKVLRWQYCDTITPEAKNELMERIIEKPTLRITKSQIEKCNRLFTQYKEQVK